MYEKQPWLKHYDETPASLNYPDLSMYALIRENREQHPDADGLIFFGRRTRRAVLDKQIVFMSRKFARIGIKKRRYRDHLPAEYSAGSGFVLRT